MTIDFETPHEIPDPPRLDFLFSFTLGGKPAATIKGAPYGTRSISKVDGGGTFWGPRLRGKVDEFGAVWALYRESGRLMDGRLVLNTSDAAQIYMQMTGISVETSPHQTEFRAGIIFEAGHPDYVWLNDVVAIGRGRTAKRNGKLSGKYIYEVFQVM